MTAAKKKPEKSQLAEGIAVESLPFDLSTLQDEGVFVNVDAKGFGCLNGRLKWRDLGVDTAKVGVDLHSPTCSLLPREYSQPLALCQTRSHQTLSRYAFRLAMTEALLGTSSYRWLTWKGFADFEARFAELKGSLEEARGNVISNYDAICTDMTARAKLMAVSSADRLRDSKLEVPEDFEDRVVQVVMGMVPSVEKVEAISIKYTVGALQLGSEMLEEQRKTLEAKNEVNRLKAEEGAISEDLRQELETKTRIRQMQLDAARDRLKSELNPLEEAAKQLHASMFESAKAILDALKERGTVPPATARRAREMAARFRLMSWSSDEDLERLLTELETVSTKKKHNETLAPDAIKNVAEEIAKMTFEAAKELGMTRMDALEV